MAAPEIEWVLLRSFAIDTMGAKLLAQFLEREGIPVSMEGAFTANVLPIQSLGETRLMVPADRIEEARQAAEAFDSGEPVTDTE